MRADAYRVSEGSGCDQVEDVPEEVGDFLLKRLPVKAVFGDMHGIESTKD